MSIFSRLLPSPVARRAKGILKTHAAINAAIDNIVVAIIKAACACGEAVKPNICFPTEKENEQRWIYVLFEFYYFFMHLANRAAFAIVGHEDRIKFQNVLSECIVPSIIEGFFEHWPQNMKDGIRHEFYEKLNNAELEYGACKERLSKDNPFTGDGLYQKLARNVAELAGSPLNPALMMSVMQVAVDNFTKMKLDQMMRDLKESGF